MFQLVTTFAGFVMLPIAAFVVARAARRLIRMATRRAVRSAQRRPGIWRVRLPRLGDLDDQIDARKVQRADAAARMLGHFVTAAIFAATVVVGLHLAGVDPVVAISSAGFVGLALALSGQEMIRNVLTGTLAVLEDRYAVGDDVVVRVSGQDIQGTIDLLGAASIRLRTMEGATVHVGHGAVECVTNLSQLPVVSDIVVPSQAWSQAERDAARRLADASNDIGLTGVVFLRDIEAHEDQPGATRVQVKTNRPLTDDQATLVERRLLGNDA